MFVRRQSHVRECRATRSHTSQPGQGARLSSEEAT
jgi:hypothetical protein